MASLLRGLLSMPAQLDVSTVQLLSQAQGLLPQKLHDVSTAVLTELIKSTAKQLAALQQQQHVGADSQAAAAASAVPTDNSSSSDSTGSSWGGSLLNQNDRQPMEVVLDGMLQECVPAWSSAQRLGQFARWQAVAVVEALEGCGQQDLAAAARQVRPGGLLDGCTIYDAACICAASSGSVHAFDSKLQDVPVLYVRQAVTLRALSAAVRQ